MREPWQQQLSQLPTAVAVALQEARASCDGLHHGDQRRRSSRSISCATAALRFFEQLASGSIKTPAARTRSAEQPAAPAATIRRASRGWCAPTTRLRSPRCIAASRVVQPSAAAPSCSTPLRVCSYARWRAAHSRMQSNSPPGIAAAGRGIVHVVLYPHVVMCPVHCASFHMHCTAVPQPCSVCESYFALPCLCLLELCYCHIASGWRP